MRINTTYSEDIPRKLTLNEDYFKEPLLELNLPWKKSAAEIAKKNLEASNKADKKLLAAGQKLAANDLSPKNRDYEFYLATGENKWETTPLTQTQIRQKFQAKDLTVKSPEFLNAIVTNAGFISRRGMESLYGKGEEFDPKDLTSMKIRTGYSVPFPEAAATETSDSEAAAKTTSKDSPEETSAEASPAEGSDASAKEAESPEQPAAQPKSVGGVTDKHLTNFKKLVYATGLTINDAFGRPVRYNNIKDLDNMTLDVLNQYEIKVKNKTYPLDKWLSTAVKSKVIKESMSRKALLEAPQLFFDDDELNNPDNINMKDIIKNRQARETAQKAAAELNAKRQALQVKYESVLDAVETSIGNGDSAIDTLEVLFDALVPSEGKADTVAGELVRALMRLLYRDYNDGDKFYEGYGIETCGSFAEYLYDNGFDAELQDIVDTIPDDDLYTNSLNELADKLIERILSEPELIAEPNEEDSREYESSEWDVEEYQPLYEFEISASDGVVRLVENGILNAWDLQSYVESSLEYEPWYNSDVTIERPWTHTSTTVELTNLTREAYDHLQSMFMNDEKLDQFWQDLVNEHIDELTDDDSEDIEDFED